VAPTSFVVCRINRISVVTRILLTHLMCSQIALDPLWALVNTNARFCTKLGSQTRAILSSFLAYCLWGKKPRLSHGHSRGPSQVAGYTLLIKFGGRVVTFNEAQVCGLGCILGQSSHWHNNQDSLTSDERCTLTEGGPDEASKRPPIYGCDCRMKLPLRRPR